MKLAELSLKDIHPSDKNTRTDYNGTDMAELIKSITSVGLLNPIIVRKSGDMGYEIVAGHRRYHALKKLGTETAAVQVVEATDEDADQIRLVENLHRKDLNPIEEAKAFQILVDHYRLDVASIAQRADKSDAYVTRALALLTLKPKTQDLIAAGSLSAAHGHQIARVEGKQRETIETYATTKLEWYKRFPMLDELKSQIEKTVSRDLAHAVFPKDVAKYGGTETPACVACPWNTGNQNALFDGAQKGSCTNPGCFTKRTNFAFSQMRDKVLAEQPKLTFIGFSADPGHYSVRDVKGYPIIDHAKRRKDIVTHPEKFGFSIRKPNRYDTKSKASIVMVSLDKKERPEQPQRQDRDWEKERFINERIVMALRVLAANEVVKLEKKHVLQMLDNDGNTDISDKDIKKMSMDDLLVRLWIVNLGSYEVVEKLKAVGVDARETVKEATKKAEADYAIEKAKKSKETKSE